jgi:xanthine dehydrogenase YagS FAD-binding subunit
VNRFELGRPKSLGEARDLLAQQDGSVFKAGGIDLLDHLKEHLAKPPRLVSLTSVPGLKGITREADGSLRLGATTTLAEVASSPEVLKTHPALAQACGEAASPQIRNVATLGGNILQRPRCWYYRLESYWCLKKGGIKCYAVNGENRYHSIFGGGPSYAVHPSNAAVALVALGATLTLAGAKDPRHVLAGDFFTLPSKDPRRENSLAPDEILTEIRVPPSSGSKSAYQELRERASFDLPVVSVAASVSVEAGRVRQASVVLGSVAPIPWRSKKAEDALVGKPLDQASAQEAARAAIVGASPLSDNGFKVGLVQVVVRRALLGLS